MCDTCGCNITPANRHLIEQETQEAGGVAAGSGTPDNSASVNVLENLLNENNRIAAHNRQHLDEHRVLTVNLMSSPGAGKTALLEASIDAIAGEFNIAVIEGDLETENDARRIRDKGVKAVQIATGTACHLDAHMVHKALHQIELRELDILFIENVGNLVCPASFDLGHHCNVTLLSVTEGDDKPAKYPVMFRAADMVLISKLDLLDILGDFNPVKAETHLRQLANPAPVLPVSARNGNGIDAWLTWLRARRDEYLHQLASGETLVPRTQSDGQRYHAQAQTSD